MPSNQARSVFNAGADPPMNLHREATPDCERPGDSAWDQVRDIAANVQSRIADGPIVPNVQPDEIRDHLLARYDFRKPVDLNDLIADVERMLSTWQVQVTHPRYFGLFNPSVTVASVIADAIVAMYNPQLATWRTSPAANEIERHTLVWLAAKFGLPADCAANFTSGGTEANLSAVITALTRAFPEFGERGIRSLPAQPVFYLTGEAHHSFSRIAHITGLGRQSVRTVATGADLKMDMDDLNRKVTKDRRNGFTPFMVVGCAGTTAAGTIDPLTEQAQLCRSESLWFHVDAAWGGAAVISTQLRQFLEGIDAADSITCDAHKWFSVPMGAGMFFCRDAEAVSNAFRTSASFMPARTRGSVADPYTSSLQWSRRFIGLKLFLALAERGESGYAAMLEHQTGMGNLLRKSLIASGWTIVNDTPLPLVCFTREGLDIDRFLADLLRHQIAWMSQVQIAGRPAIRACVTSFRTTASDINNVVAGMDRLL